MDSRGPTAASEQSKQKILKENFLDGVILVYNRYSEQQTWNLTKRKTVPPAFFRDIFHNGWLWTAASEQSKQKISKKTFLVELF